MISVLIQPFIEILFLNVIVLIAWKDKNLYKVVKKNLEGHQKRNIKTAIMFTISISFLIFAGSSFSLISHMIIS